MKNLNKFNIFNISNIRKLLLLLFNNLYLDFEILEVVRSEDIKT